MSMAATGPTYHELRRRLACGHFGPNEDDCDECRYEGPSPDLWLVCGGDVNLNRQAETRCYRQAKYRNRP